MKEKFASAFVGTTIGLFLVDWHFNGFDQATDSHNLMRDAGMGFLISCVSFTLSSLIKGKSE